MTINLEKNEEGPLLVQASNLRHFSCSFATLLSCNHLHHRKLPYRSKRRQDIDQSSSIECEAMRPPRCNEEAMSGNGGDPLWRAALPMEEAHIPVDTLVHHSVSSFPKKDFDSSLVCRLNQSFVMLPQFLCPMHHVSRVAQQFLTESGFKILL